MVLYKVVKNFDDAFSRFDECRPKYVALVMFICLSVTDGWTDKIVLAYIVA